MSHGVADGAETRFGDWRGLGHVCGLCCGVWGSRDVPWHCRAGARQVGLAPRRKKMRLIPNSAGQGMGLSRRSARPSSPGRRGRCGDAFLRGAVSAARTGTHIPALAATGLQHRPPGDPSFQDSQLLRWGTTEELSPSSACAPPAGVTGSCPTRSSLRATATAARVASPTRAQPPSAPCLSALMVLGSPRGRQGYF